MTTKYIKYSIFGLSALAIGLVGCSDNKSITESAAAAPVAYTSGSIKYDDGTDFGVTRKEALNNGGAQIYSIGTGEVIGFIQVDGLVNDIGGKDLGVCENASVTDNGLTGDCVIPGLKSTAPDISNSKYPAIPDYPVGANSIGQLEVNCKDDIIYYTLAYVCFKSTVKLSTTADGKDIAEDEDSKRGSDPFTYYERGHYNRDDSGKQVTLVGTVTGGNPGGTYRQTCPSI